MSYSIARKNRTIGATASIAPPLNVATSPVVTKVSEAGLTLTLFLIGAGLSQRMLRAVGWKPMLQGVVLWIFISATSLGVIILVVH